MTKVTLKRFLMVFTSFFVSGFLMQSKWTKLGWIYHSYPDVVDFPPLEETLQHRRSIVKVVCERNNLTKNSIPLKRKVKDQLYVEHSHKFIYCEVPKVGCSNWKRIILLMNDLLGHSASHLQHEMIHKSSLLHKLSSYPLAMQEKFLANYTKVMFTRDPLERVVSAYRDKFLHEDEEYYFKTIANQIRRRVGINVNSTNRISFQEFVQFIVVEDPKYRDTHWKPMFQLCDPCNIQYDIIGKFENINQEAAYVLKTIGAPKELKYPTVKHYPYESRTNKNSVRQYLKALPPNLYRQLLEVYSVDFSMFDYSLNHDL